MAKMPYELKEAVRIDSEDKVIFEAFQRPEEPALCRSIERDWNPRAIGTVTLAEVMLSKVTRNGKEGVPASERERA